MANRYPQPFPFLDFLETIENWPLAEDCFGAFVVTTPTCLGITIKITKLLFSHEILQRLACLLVGDITFIIPSPMRYIKNLR